MSKIIEAITKSQLRTDIPEFKAGDTVRVHVRIDVLNYTTYVTYVVKLLVLEKYDNKNKRRSPITLCFRVFFFILNIFYIIYQ